MNLVFFIQCRYFWHIQGWTILSYVVRHPHQHTTLFCDIIIISTSCFKFDSVIALFLPCIPICHFTRTTTNIYYCPEIHSEGWSRKVRTLVSLVRRNYIGLNIFLTYFNIFLKYIFWYNENSSLWGFVVSPKHIRQ